VRVAIYARVSTTDQTCENQLLELRRHVGARGWEVYREFVDHGVSGAKERRPALDELLRDAKRRRFDVLAVWSLDRLGRSLRHLIAILDDLQALGIAFVSLREGLDLSTPSGRLQWQIIGAISEFERSRISERVRSGLSRARREGKRLGRPKAAVPIERVTSVAHLSVEAAASALGVSESTMRRWRRACQKTPPTAA
jgi:DNA invertase Pin-like site-specific DNA recombinase